MQDSDKKSDYHINEEPIQCNFSFMPSIIKSNDTRDCYKNGMHLKKAKH